MNPIIETLKNWRVLSSGVPLIEEKHVFDVIYDGKSNSGGDLSYSGQISLTCRFFLIGDQKIPTSEQPTAIGELHAVSSGGIRYAFLLSGKELWAVTELEGEVIFILAPIPPFRYWDVEWWLRTQIHAASSRHG